MRDVVLGVRGWGGDGTFRGLITAITSIIEVIAGMWMERPVSEKSRASQSVMEHLEDPRRAGTLDLKARLIELERRVGDLEVSKDTGRPVPPRSDS